MTMTPRSSSSSGSSLDICAAAKRETLNVPLRKVFTVNSKPSSDAGEPSRPTVRPPAPALPPQFTATRSGPRPARPRPAAAAVRPLFLGGDVGPHELGAPAELGGDLLAALLVEVGDHDVGPGG